MIIDFHTHCFAEDIVERAMGSLTKISGYIPSTDGSVAGLIKSMDIANVDMSVIQPIATKQSQTQKINDWAMSLKSDRLDTFGTIHHEYKNWEEEIERLYQNGVKGIKFHPDYQGFFVDDKKMYPIYEKVASLGMTALFHCGVDVAFPDIIRCTPKRLKNVLDNIKNLKVVGAHMGGHRMFDEVYDILCSLDLYIDTSCAHYILGDEGMTRMIKKHGVDKVLFASDSPWGDVKEGIEVINRLGFTSSEKDMIFYKNANNLLA